MNTVLLHLRRAIALGAVLAVVVPRLEATASISSQEVPGSLSAEGLWTEPGGDELLYWQAVVVRNGIARAVASEAERREHFWQLGIEAFGQTNYEAAEVFFEAYQNERKDDEQQAQGTYWVARALEAQGDLETALRFFTAAVDKDQWGYYGALAKGRLDLLWTSQSAICERVNEFMMDSKALGAAAATNRRWRHLFPTNLVRLLERVATRHSVDGAWAVALAGQESGFSTEVISRAGAVGLMQVMPATGNRVLRRDAQRLRETAVDLLDAQINAEVGVAYFRGLLQRFDGDELLALAAYNAGPNAVSRWKRRWPQLDSDLLVEKIPYRETKHYVKRVNQWRRKYIGVTEARQALEESRRAPSVMAAAGIP